jgi:hypothetical protein
MCSIYKKSPFLKMQKYTKKSNYCNNQKKDVSLHRNSQGLHRVQIALRQYFESDVSLRFPLQTRGGRKGNRVQIASCRATVNRRYHGMAEHAIGPLQVREGATPETKARRPAAMSFFSGNAFASKAIVLHRPTPDGPSAFPVPHCALSARHDDKKN